VPEQGASGVGERDGARGPVEQGRPDAVLELAELGAQRLLGDVQPPGGTSEVQLIGENLEGLEVAELDIHNAGL
jgi:hypothetical protein